MGAYENPITVIDTESGKIWANTALNISKIAANSMKAFKERKTAEAKFQQKQITDITANALKNQTALFDRLSKVGIKSDAFFNYGMSVMDDVSRLQSQIKLLKVN